MSGNMTERMAWRSGGAKPSNLEEQVARQMWRTPDANCGRGPSSAERMDWKLKNKMPISINDQVRHPEKMWPTPTVQDSKNNGSESQQTRNTKPLNAEVSGQLNPQWVEWLMGYPQGWTDLKD